MGGGTTSVEAVVPEIETQVSMEQRKADYCGYIKEVYACSPMFTLGYTTKLTEGEVVATWLKLEKVN